MRMHRARPCLARSILARCASWPRCPENVSKSPQFLAIGQLRWHAGRVTPGAAIAVAIGNPETKHGGAGAGEPPSLDEPGRPTEPAAETVTRSPIIAHIACVLPAD
jgi:hypothetical protein